jgi:hypothetical protein
MGLEFLQIFAPWNHWLFGIARWTQMQNVVAELMVQGVLGVLPRLGPIDHNNPRPINHSRKSAGVLRQVRVTNLASRSFNGSDQFI